MAKTSTRAKAQTQAPRSTAPAASTQEAESVLTINGTTRAKLCLFAIPQDERVEDGPVMRGFLETDAGQVQLAGWKKLARDSGNEYLSLKLGNTKRREEDTPDDVPDEYLIGPFYGRLFKEVTEKGENKTTRYFGFIEHSEKVGTDAQGKGIYTTHWQLQVRGKPDMSNDRTKRYISGSVYPKEAANSAHGDNDLPF